MKNFKALGISLTETVLVLGIIATLLALSPLRRILTSQPKLHNTGLTEEQSAAAQRFIASYCRPLKLDGTPAFPNCFWDSEEECRLHVLELVTRCAGMAKGQRTLCMQREELRYAVAKKTHAVSQCDAFLAHAAEKVVK